MTKVQKGLHCNIMLYKDINIYVNGVSHTNLLRPPYLVFVKVIKFCFLRLKELKNLFWIKFIVKNVLLKQFLKKAATKGGCHWSVRDSIVLLL